jgi:hypothetical protein
MQQEVVMMHKGIRGWEERTRGFTLIELLKAENELAETTSEEAPRTSD